MPRSKDLLDPPDGQPRRFGDYLIHGILGEGGMARVYAGEEVLSRRPVALKVLRAEFARSAHGRGRFLEEMSILANLDDPHIVRCLLCTEIEEQPVMVLEQLEGWTLRQMIEQRVALPWPEASAVALQIAKALHTAHSRQPAIVHRDLKPENVMCLPDGRVKVMDFGIAKILEALSGSTTQPHGTLRYMSPEHIDARPLDGRADLFALGLLLWEMLVGQPPFQAGSPRLLLEQICTQPTPMLPDHVRQGLPPQLEQLLHRLLAKQPAGRPANAGEVIAVLSPLAGPAITVSRRAPPAQTGRTQLQPAPPPASSSSPPLHSTQVVDEGRKSPLQRQVEARFDGVAQAVSRFGRATSALIVRILVGLMIAPAAAVVFAGIPIVLVVLNSYLLAEEQGIEMHPSYFEDWAQPEVLLGLAIVVSVIVFIRACWVHHREGSGVAALKPWVILGVVIIAGWGGITAMEFAPDSKLPEEVHYVSIASASIWLGITLSWFTGHLSSRVLRRLEMARAPD